MILPPNLSLLPFQKDGVELMLKRLTKSGGVYCGDDMGLGKTIQTIVTLNTTPRSIFDITLIVCPAVMRLVWRDELMKWSVGATEQNTKIYKSKTDLNALGKFAINIISYDLARNDAFIRKLQKLDLKIDFLILDEAHRVKTSMRKSKRSKAVFTHLWPRATYKIALSGTPFTKSVEDGYTLFHRFNPDYFPDWYTYVNTYMNRKHNGFGIQYEGLKNAEKLKKGLKTFFFRRTKEKVLKDLPPVTYKKISLDSSLAVKLSAAQAQEMEAYHKELQAMFDKETVFKVKPPPVPVMTMRREQGRKKTKSIIEYVEILLEQSVPIVLFGIFRDELKVIEDAFVKYKPAIIHGNVESSKRELEIKRFQCGETPLFIGQIASAGEGITLTRSCDVVLSETPYSPAEIKQAIDRVVRIGQKNAVTVHYFVVDKSVDEKIIANVMKKAETFSKVFV